jgi:hypothetical protein
MQNYVQSDSTHHYSSLITVLLLILILLIQIIIKKFNKEEEIESKSSDFLMSWRASVEPQKPNAPILNLSFSMTQSGDG